MQSAVAAPATRTRDGRRRPRADRVRVNRPPLTTAPGIERPDAARTVAATLSDLELRVANWYYVDGLEMKVIGEWIGQASRQYVNMVLNRVDAKLRTAGLPPPHRLEHPYETRHVRNFNWPEWE